MASDSPRSRANADASAGSGPAELQLDGLVGPTHHYGGLGAGNRASRRHGGEVSRPRDAALQGIAKMRAVAELGGLQGVLPPHDRPAADVLRRLGFAGSDADAIERAAREAPELLSACASASAMWSANAATVTPSVDAADGRLHVTPANLAQQLHRAIETPTTQRLLAAVLADPERVAHHAPLPATDATADEGAANHMRLAPSLGSPGVSVFVHGRPVPDGAAAPARYRPRQSRAASEGVARAHGVAPERTVLLRQSAAAIDAGAFHNDVVAVSNEDVLLFHERAFAAGPEARRAIEEAYRRATGGSPSTIVAREADLPLEEAIRSYVFNAQLLTRPDGGMTLLCPAESRENDRARAFLEQVPGAGTRIDRVAFVELRQSMKNGGGPACLRLRVPLAPSERGVLAPGVCLDAELAGRLEAWVRRHYRETLTPADLGDPDLLAESRTALDELTGLLGLGSVYPFQRAGAGLG